MKNKHEEPQIEVALENLSEENEIELPFVITLYGELNEEKAEEVINELYTAIKIYKRIALKESEMLQVTKDDGDEESPLPEKPTVHLVLSTFGGSVHDMFSIYDCIQELKKYSDVSVLGLGKVQSAGVGLLCAGTVGKRKIGPNCRLMLHPVSFGTYGSVKATKSELDETAKISKMYEKLLKENTKMNRTEIKKYMNQEKNFYFSAEEALKKGIVDDFIGSDA